ncbi:Oidioi.mRNA.OKI2018_I69.chr1.g3884.t1.cds [Oikopleura dioica]|uniref:Oidioi.mRNA.OKI2018_I69.chr1.g3884.t1.cds n=1 Tax=Oikopleura dioica TaxID=34765 RepID=A0ABN7T123_OIKDI|nr:Oidioi.mRNA.OKI2018_I69.chr1.g3884.t1.cds [Oikopleura dioica]
MSKRPRFMTKSGECNIRHDAKEKTKRFLQDFFTTLVDLKWTYSLGVFLSYLTAFLFFLETETTVGYGRRNIQSNCPEAVLALVIQCLIGTFVDAVMVGCIFIKLSKPTNRTDTLIFSTDAVISQRDGKYCLMFRVGNLRSSLIVQCRIRAKFVKNKQTTEGEFIPLMQTDMNVGFDTGADKLFLVTPLIVCHEINEKSPLWEMSEEDINQKHFEIIVILEGIVESTGMICQARTSYLNTETKWGFRFMPMLFQSQHHFTADHSNFNSTYEIRMPAVSASLREKLQKDPFYKDRKKLTINRYKSLPLHHQHRNSKFSTMEE